MVNCECFLAFWMTILLPRNAFTPRLIGQTYRIDLFLYMDRRILSDGLPDSSLEHIDIALRIQFLRSSLGLCLCLSQFQVLLCLWDKRSLMDISCRNRRFHPLCSSSQRSNRHKKKFQMRLRWDYAFL